MGPLQDNTRLLRIYYLATPAFGVLDAVVGVNIRIAALPDPALRMAYYAFAFGCGLLCRWRPRLTPAVGVTESSLNVLLLVLSIMLPIWQLTETVFTDAPLVTPFSTVSIGNFILSGSVLVASFHLHQATLSRRRSG